MKRILMVVAGIVAIFALVVAAVLAGTFWGMTDLEDGRAIGSAITVKDGYVAAFMIPTGDGVLLVDAGDDRDAEALLAALAKRQLGPDDVKAVFITHGHPDHMAGVPKFPRAAVYALEREVPIAEGREVSSAPVLQCMGPQPNPAEITHPLTSGSSVAIGNQRVEVFALPGHTPGSAAYLIDGQLFVGDSASAHEDGYLMPGPWIVTDDQDQNRASLIALARLLEPRKEEVKWIVPAHTAPVAGLAPLGDPR